MNNNHAYLGEEDLALSDDVHEFTFKAERILGATAIKGGISEVATDLLTFAVNSIGNKNDENVSCVQDVVVVFLDMILMFIILQPISTAIVFVARDLGGTVLKQVCRLYNS